MSQEVSTNRIALKPSEAETPSQPWAMENSADRLMDDVFSDVDRMLETGGEPPTQTAEPEYVSLQQMSIPPILIPQGMTAHQVETSDISDADKAQKQHDRGNSLNKLLLGAAIASLAITLLLWLAGQGRLNKLFGINVASAPSAQKSLSEADGEFIDYMQRSLDLIEQETENNQQVASVPPPPPASALLPVPIPGNLPQSRPSTVLERVYIPVYPRPQIVYVNPPAPPAVKAAPTIAATVRPTAKATPTVAATVRPTAKSTPTVAATVRPTAKATPTVAASRPTATATPKARPTSRPTAKASPTVAAALRSIPIASPRATATVRATVKATPTTAATSRPTPTATPRVTASSRPTSSPTATTTRPTSSPTATTTRPTSSPTATTTRPTSSPPAATTTRPTSSPTVATTPLPAPVPPSPAAAVAPNPAPQPTAIPQQTTQASASVPAIKHTLMGVLVLGDKSAAIFEVNGASRRIHVGESIASSGWILVEVRNDEAIVRRNGEVRSIYVGQEF